MGTGNDASPFVDRVVDEGAGTLNAAGLASHAYPGMAPGTQCDYVFGTLAAMTPKMPLVSALGPAVK